MIKMSFFEICKLTIDSSLAYGGLYNETFLKTPLNGEFTFI